MAPGATTTAAAAAGGDHMKEAVGLPVHPSTRIVTFPSFRLGNGATLVSVELAFSTYGTLNEVSPRAGSALSALC
jgi:homoserine acetyltransferase